MSNLEIIGQGATTTVYRDGGKAIKMYVNAPPGEVENEAMLQSYAAKMGLPVPLVYGVREIDESTTALDMEYIPGKPLLHEGMNKDEGYAAIQTLVKLQCEVHAKNAPGLPTQKDRLSWKINRNSYIDAPAKERLLALLEDLETKSNKLCHGDFHPLNILYDGKEHWIIDWVDASSGSPLADACRTYIIFKQYLSHMAGVYLRYFCKEAGARQEDVLAWLPVIAAARMAEGVDERARVLLMGVVDEGINTG